MPSALAVYVWCCHRSSAVLLLYIQVEGCCRPELYPQYFTAGDIQYATHNQLGK